MNHDAVLLSLFLFLMVSNFFLSLLYAFGRKDLLERLRKQRRG